MYKKVIGILLAIALVLPMSACGSKTPLLKQVPSVLVPHRISFFLLNTARLAAIFAVGFFSLLKR